MDDFLNHLPAPYKGFLLRKSDGFFIPSSEGRIKALEVINKNRLKKIEISPLYFKSTDISFLANAGFIESINIMADDVDLTPLNKLKNLKEIFLQPVRSKTAGKIDFANFPLLETCYLDWDVKGSESILTNRNVKNLTVDGFDRTELFHLSAGSQLKELSIRSGSIVSLAGIDKLRSLTKLELSLCKGLESLEGIERMRQLKELRIEYCKHVKSFQPIGTVHSLVYLNLSNDGVIGNIDFVSSLVNLREFCFAGNTNIKDGNLFCLEHLKKNFQLKECVFQNRRHYSHKREDLGYELSPYLKKLFGK
jgi:hypothetical protein